MRHEPHVSSSRPGPADGRGVTLPAAGLARVLGVLALLVLGACAGPGTPPAADNSALMVQRAYAENAQVRGVADALDARLDRMLAEQTAMLAP